MIYLLKMKHKMFMKIIWHDQLCFHTFLLWHGYSVPGDLRDCHEFLWELSSFKQQQKNHFKHFLPSSVIRYMVKNKT